MAARGTFEECLQRCSRGRHSTRDISIRHVRRSGRRLFERDCILEHQIFRFAKMILRDRCSTSYDPHFLLAVAVLQRLDGKIAKRIGTRPSALHLTIHYRLRKLRKSQSRRIASFLTLSSSKIEGVSRKVLLFFSLFQFSNCTIVSFSSLPIDR